MLKFLFAVLLTLGSVLGPGAQAASVLFLNPGSTTEAFWISYSQFMQAAANDLGMDLQILYSQRMPELTIAQARTAPGLIGRTIWYSPTNNTSPRKSCGSPRAAG